MFLKQIEFRPIVKEEQVFLVELEKRRKEEYNVSSQ